MAFDNIFRLLAEGAEYLNLKEKTKIRDRVIKIQMDLLKEEERGDDSDDAKIEHLWKELDILAGDMLAQAKNPIT